MCIVRSSPILTQPNNLWLVEGRAGGEKSWKQQRQREREMFGRRVWCENSITTTKIIIPPLQTLTLALKLNPKPSSNPRFIRSRGRHCQTTTSTACSNSSSGVVRSPSLVELEYADLNLSDKYGHSQVLKTFEPPLLKFSTF